MAQMIKKDKFYPIILRHVNQYGDVGSRLLEVPVVKEASCTGENIFNTLNDVLKKHGLSRENCLALGADNANVMSGRKKGVIGWIQQQNPSVYFAGCPCHLIHLSAKYASSCLPTNVGDRLVDVYFYLKHSAKRQTELTDLKHDHGVDDLAVLKYCPTRWLSLHQCVKRVLELWGPLKEYFVREASTNSGEREVRCKEFFQSHTAKAVCYFLDFILDEFDQTNKALQHEKPLIHKSRRIIVDLYKSLLLKFLKSSAFTSNTNDLEINIKTPYWQKEDKDLVLGTKCRKFMAEKKMNDKKQKIICEGVRKFYCSAAEYILKKLPITEEHKLLKHAEVFDLRVISNRPYQSLEYFLEEFPVLRKQITDPDKLHGEFLKLQVEKLPASITEEKDAGKQWNAVGQILDDSDSPKYLNITNLARSVLLIPHSNACCERTFSHVRKVRTEFRPTLGQETLASICVMKEGMQAKCYEGNVSKELGCKAKSATVRFLASANQESKEEDNDSRGIAEQVPIEPER